MSEEGGGDGDGEVMQVVKAAAKLTLILFEVRLVWGFENKRGLVVRYPGLYCWWKACGGGAVFVVKQCAFDAIVCWALED